MAFTVIPAIDVRNGRVVRLSQGDYGRETVFDDSPLATAQRYAEAGATWLHLVDLDAARQGAYSLQALLAALARIPLQVQTGGGIRSEDDIEAIFSAGATRVVVGTLAVREPSRVCAWIKTYGSERIALALDVRKNDSGAWELPVAGWTESSAASLDGLLNTYADAGLTHLLCTDISRDGMLSGFNLDLYRMLSKAWPRLQIQASGGVRDVDDIIAARDANASAAILGRALLENRFTLADALTC
jgi:phosphoribosylformimino-5-aminoimidazole carboxamide ribotide isomerase